MARYDVFRAPPDGKAPYLLDLQSDLLDVTGTRVVVPLFRRADYARPATILHPEFDVEGERCVLLTHFIFTIAEAELGERVTSLKEAHFAIGAALDRLLAGY